MRLPVSISLFVLLLAVALPLHGRDACARTRDRMQSAFASMSEPSRTAIPRAIVVGTSLDDSIPVRNEGNDRRFAIVVRLGGGISEYLAPYDSPVEIERGGMAFSMRICLHPDHRLHVGFETGWTRFYTYDLKDVETSFGHTDASLSLSAVPLLVVFSMPIVGSLTVSGGGGGYLVRSHASSFGRTVDISRFSQGWIAALSWDLPLSGSIGIGLELKIYGATEFGDGVVVAQLQMPLILFRW